MEEQPTKGQEEAEQEQPEQREHQKEEEQQQENQQEEEGTKKKEETAQKTGETVKEQQHQLLTEEEIPCQNLMNLNQFGLDLNQNAHLINDVVVGIASELQKAAEESASFDDEVSVADSNKMDGKEQEKVNEVERKGKKLERGKEAETETYKGDNKDSKAQHTRKRELKKKLPESLISPYVIRTINPNEMLTT